MKQILILITLSAIFTSCGQISSDDVEQDIIKTDYSLSYNEDNSQVVAQGYFTVGGHNSTFVKLDGLSNLKVNGNNTKLEATLLGQLSYVFKRSASYDAERSYRFDYTNKDEDTFSNIVKLPSLISMATLTTVESDQPVIIDWTVQNPNDGATSLNININHDNGFFSKQLDPALPSGQFEISREELAFYRGQSITINLCRKKRAYSINNPGAGGSLSAAYCAKSKSVTLKI